MICELWIADHLAVHGSDARAAERDVLDDALQLVGRMDHDRVADRVPALDEHREARDQVDQELPRDERGDEHGEDARDRGQAVDAACELREFERTAAMEKAM